MIQNKIVFILLLLSSLTLQQGRNARFDKYINTFGKKYKDINEYNFRLNIYNQNLQQIAEHNANPSITYDLGNSYYTDIEDAQFVKIVLNDGGKYLDEYAKIPLTTTKKVFDGILKSIPVSKDAQQLNWSKKKLVSPVKNQGICGNGYVFGAIGSIESALMVQTPILKVSYSEQQVTDCCKSQLGYSCNGCDGGSLLAVFQYIAKTGVSTTKSYQYQSEDGKVRQCRNLTSPDKIASSGSYVRIPPQNLSALHQQLSKRPISIVVDATNWAQYQGGIFSNCSQSLSSNNHAALLVGYDDKGNWLVKNSWGEKWGQQGYITLSPGNTCGISNYAVSFYADEMF